MIQHCVADRCSQLAIGGRLGAPRATRWGRQPRGVTAMELLILVVLLVIVAVFAIPNMSPVVLYLRVRGAAWQLGGDLRLARQRAVTLQKRFRVCLRNCAISVPAGAYSLERDDGSPGSPRWVSETGAPVQLPANVTVTATATPAFSQNGMASGSTFTISNVMNSYQVVVASTGRVLICEGSCP
jgi:Tfp pilus assembly protein FimT